MSHHRNWMYRDEGENLLIYAEEFIKGVEEFLDFAFAHPECTANGMIRCPSSKCDFNIFKNRESVQMCLLNNGFVPDYKRWTRHGESNIEVETINTEDERNENWADEMLREAAGPNFDPYNEIPNTQSKIFYDLFESCNEPLWKGCESYTKLTAVSHLLHLKSEYGIPIKGFNELLIFIKRMLPMDEKLPESYYKCKALMKGLGLPHEKIHACENDCVLFWGKNVDLITCPTCGESRYKNFDVATLEKRKPIPKKVMHYFPLIPRLQRLYLSSKTAEHMRWHSSKRMDVEGELRHPADAMAWKDFDCNFPDFAADSRNIRLGLATDGFNPFGHSSKPHSTWPVFIVPYNLPPWMCMKPSYMFMPLVIPGPKGPGRELDVFLEPLIDELKTLWYTGVDTYDIFLKQNFSMRAALMWTISDFPAYGMLSGWSTHGKLSCPVCMDNTIAFTLKEGRKPCYFGCHRRWLKPTHRFRSNKNNFNNKTERKLAPPRLMGNQVLDYINQFDLITYGKGQNSDERIPGFGVDHNWTKKSIFFELPYWHTLLIRHNLDLMHIEKNVFDNVFNTVMNVKGKTKDNHKSRLDLETLGIRPELHSKLGNNGKPVYPKAKYTLTNEQIKQVYEWLQSLKVPDGYAGNISRCVNPKECKMSGLKTHDCHILMERFLPLALREFLPKEVWEPLNVLSQFFKDICSKVYKEEELEKLESGIIETLCRLEMIFPPSFFDSMEHLPIHLAYEAKVGGPVQYRWMYPFERCMQHLKRKVRNKACPEGSIAQASWVEEVANFCSHYFDPIIETKLNKADRNDDGVREESKGSLPIFNPEGRALGKAKQRFLSDEEINAIGLYVLLNCDYERAYDKINEHRLLVQELHPNMTEFEVEEVHNRTLFQWFHQQFKRDNDNNLKFLAMGPYRDVTTYKRFLVNGFRFHTNKLELGRVTQNSGVVVKGSNYGDDSHDYYGHLEEVVEVHYYGGNTIFLFKCEWYDPTKGVEVDKYGFTKVNTKSRLRSYEPFVIASQVLQVFYANLVSKKNQGWSSVITTKARNTYDVMEKEEDEDANTYQEDEILSVNMCNFDYDSENVILHDNTEPGVEVETVEEEAESEDEDEDQDNEEDDDDPFDEFYDTTDEDVDDTHRGDIDTEDENIDSEDGDQFDQSD